MEMNNKNSSMPTKKEKMNKKTLLRVIKTAFVVNKPLFVFAVIFIILNASCNITGPLFIQRFIDDIINPSLSIGSGMTEAIKGQIINYALIMGSLFLFGVICNWLYRYFIVLLTQGMLHKLRVDMFSHMEKLPISFFDTHHHGDIMSFYTNDADTLRMLASEALPMVLVSFVSVIAGFITMAMYSIYLLLVVILFSVIMILFAKFSAMRSAKAFMTQQTVMGEVEGFVEEMMSGQKVVKVFNHEKQTIDDFDKLNDEYYKLNLTGNIFGNILMPIIQNIGLILFITVAFVGGCIVAFGPTYNITLTGFSTLTIGTVVSFMLLSRQFTNAISQASSQLSMIVMGSAGASRVFMLLDQDVEVDNGNVTLVNCTIDDDGTIHEVPYRTGYWAWKQPANDKYPLTYRRLRGDIRFFNVDFGYTPNKIVLHDVSLYAKPGQKIAFVGATGAGKTTITNLINRFYDIADGKIRYDDININTIKKADLRRSLGIVLQDTNLFTGTIMDNIRYGRMDASDEDCIEAAKLANAHDFIMMMPEGYKTLINGDGGSLSQGQKQLISIARAACCNAPVVILDEATSSIDTRTEALVQKGIDKLMEGRTVFVIAHRLSTVQNADAIMVLDHGKVIERGTHDDLIKQKGVYYQLYTGAFELE